MVLFNYFVPGRGVKYCDEHVCMFVCLFACLEYDVSKFTKFSVRVTCGRGLVLLWHMLCTSSFVDDVMCADNGTYDVWLRGHIVSDSPEGSTDSMPLLMGLRYMPLSHQGGQKSWVRSQKAIIQTSNIKGGISEVSGKFHQPPKRCLNETLHVLHLLGFSGNPQNLDDAGSVKCGDEIEVTSDWSVYYRK